jgi:hypothetical protein
MVGQFATTTRSWGPGAPRRRLKPTPHDPTRTLKPMAAPQRPSGEQTAGRRGGDGSKAETDRLKTSWGDVGSYQGLTRLPWVKTQWTDAGQGLRPRPFRGAR